MVKRIRIGKDEGMFAATPPLGALRMLRSSAVTGNDSKVLMFNGISPAYMHAWIASDMLVDLCDEDKTESGDEQRCGKLTKSMYGTRAAARNWQSKVTRTKKELGFQLGTASPCVFWNRQGDIKALVHGYGFASFSDRSELEWLCRGGLQKQFETKMTMVGEDIDLAKEARVLNGIARWHP